MDKTAITGILKSFIHPNQLRIILHDALKLKNKQYSNIIHLEAAMEWLCRTQDKSGCGGCSATYSITNGWAPPYPETTGYIISTFLRYGAFSNNDNYFERAKLMGDWEIEIQLPSGAVRGGSGINEYPIVFNTGMVILGWMDLFHHTGDDRYLNSSIRAADWLCSNMDSDGKWSKNTYNGIPHAYHTRVSWALLEVFNISKDLKYKEAALRNINWVLSLVLENGWIEEMGFSKGEIPFTHTIAYTIRGLLECSVFFEGELKTNVQNIAIHAAEKIMYKFEINKRHPNSNPKLLAGRFNSKWQSCGNFSCLTGDAQFAIIWLKIYKLNSDARFLNAALKILDQLKETQNIKSTNQGIRGGIAGSYPIWGSYMQYYYPSWAAKFFADALMLQETIMKELK